MKWKRVLSGKTYCDSDRRFVLEFMGGTWWLSRAEQRSDNVLRPVAPLGSYRTCREARKAAEQFAAAPPMSL